MDDAHTTDEYGTAAVRDMLPDKTVVAQSHSRRTLQRTGREEP
jgi:hypothetical protein